MPRSLAVFAANAREAANSLRRARMRTVLGLIGIMIGISSVIAMVSMGEIAKQQARQEFEALGTDMLVVRPGASSVTGQRLPIEVIDAVEMADSVASISEAAPRIPGYQRLRHGGRIAGEANLQGVTQAFAQVNQFGLQAGRFVSDLDIDRHYCVLGAEIALSLGIPAERLVGDIVEVGEMLCTVIGVLEPRVESYALPVLVNADHSVFLPISTAQRAVSRPEIEVILGRSHPEATHEQAVEDIRSYFRGRSPELDVEIVTAMELIAQMESQMRILSLLLGAVGSISLIVGGIGIMNIMLVSVAERRTEIAIRRALGARRRDIRSQFLIESIMLTLSGGALGVGLGLGATRVICSFTGWEFLISGISVASGLGTATAIGLFFGLQPAHQASKLDPIAGLQGS